MPVHNEAKIGEISNKVLLPGDPIRAKFIAENFLENAKCYNKIRGMLGYTGTYRGECVSVQGTGMGIPSASIYIHELINYYNANKLIRVGTCGAIQNNINLRDIIIPMTASTNSSYNKNIFNLSDFAPSADFDLLSKSVNLAKNKNINYHVGSVMSSDIFYSENFNSYELWAKYGTLALEMETSALYTLSNRFNVKALSLLTVSDSLIHKQTTSPDEREKSFSEMVELALNTII